MQLSLKKIFVKTAKTIGWVLLVLLFLFIAIAIALQSASVQTWAVGKLTKLLTENLRTEVQVGGVDIEFFKTAVLSDIFIADRQKDTLLLAKELKINIGLLDLLGREIYLENAEINGARVKLYRNTADSVFNYQFLIDAFASDTSSVDTTSAGFTFGISRLVLNNVKFDMWDKGQGRFALQTNIGNWETDVGNLDLKRQQISLKKMVLDNSSIAFKMLERDSAALVKKPTDPTPLTFPKIGWDVSADKILLDKNHVIYQDENAPVIKNALDFNHLNLENLTLPIRDFRYSDDGIYAKITSASFKDESGFSLVEFAVETEILPNKIVAKDLILRTPQSDFRNNTSLIFTEFNDLEDILHQVKLSSDFAESRLAVSDLLLLAPALKEVKSLQFPENETLTMSGGFEMENEKINFEAFHFSVGNGTELSASGSIFELMDDPNYDLKIQQLSTSYRSLKTFLQNVELPPALEKFGNFSLTGRVGGTIGNLQGDNLRLTTESDTRFVGNLKITGLPNIDDTFFDLNINELTTRSDDLKGFSKTPLPSQLDSLGLVRFAGNFKGTTRKFAIDGSFNTAAGIADTKLKLDFNEDYSNANYDGDLRLQDFDLGKLLGDTSQIGKVSLDTRLEGSGLSLDELNTTIDGVVKKLHFNRYDYTDLRIDGRFDQRRFTGKLGMDDPNLRFTFDGVANLNDSLPDLDITLDIDTVNFEKLNFYQSPLGMSGQLVAKINGNNLDNLSGTASLTNFAVASDRDKYFDPAITLTAEQPDGNNRALHFKSKFMRANVAGKYKFADLNDLIIGYINDFFPIDDLTSLPEDSELHPRPKVAHQRFDFDIHFTALSDVADIFLPGFTAVDSTAFLSGSFDSETQQLEMQGAFPTLAYGGIRADSLLFSAKGSAQRLESTLALRQLDLNGAFFAPQLNLKTRLNNDSLRFDFAVLDDTLGKDFHLAGSATKAESFYELRLAEDLVLNNKNWKIDRSNLVEFTRNQLIFKDLNLKNGQQTVSIASVGEAPPNDFAPLELQFANFRLRELSGLLNNPSLNLKGGMNGQFKIIEPLTNLHYNASLNVDSLTLNEQLLGQFSVGASQQAGSKVVDLSVALTGSNEASIKGSYDVPQKAFNLSANLEHLSLVVADPFLVGLIEKSEGYLTGNFTLKGTPDAPALKGSITTNDVNTRVVLSGTRYSTNGATISFSEKEIGFKNFVLTDPKGGTATLTGEIRHEYFNNIHMNLRARTSNLQVLNTTSNDNQLYYGKLFASADVLIGGTPELPSLDITATTLDSTLLHVQPLYQQLAVVQEDYIIFANPANYQGDSLAVLEKQLDAGSQGFDLTLRLQVTPDASLNIIIDPSTGDQLFCRGSGNLIVKMDPAGNVDITGRYVIEDGKYSFNYEGLVKREFEIRNGSSLTFTGDPLNARFDITAVYNTRATTYELIANESALDETTLSNSQRRTSVQVLLNIDGDLAAPQISFDILLPENQGGVVDNLVQRKLAALRDEPTEMNKQVFGLLLFNSFIAQESGTGLATVGENAALKSVSNLISGQLNRLAGRFIKGVDLTLGFESYRAAGDNAATVAEVQLGVSKKLFNDRLTIRVGGNFNLENTQQSSLQQGGYSAIAGDFVLEYKLTSQGNYLLKVFHESDYNILLDANTYKTGVGVVYRKSY
ncbi:MAG: hypothetical protein GC192_15990 [Bacteroidetes bacterium]|nr:hypothetical protein [Bacteroidota bacterium]